VAMKHILLLSALSIGLLSGCSTAFKTGQTPDDVYYSPGRDQEETYVKEEQKQLKQKEAYQEYTSYQDDRYLRMKVANYYRWNSLDNFDYWNDSRYDFNVCNCKTGWNNYSAWNPSIYYGSRYGYGYNVGWSSPIYTLVKYAGPAYVVGGGNTSGTNISAYKNKYYTNNNLGYKDPKTGNFIPSGSSSNSFSDLLKRVFTGGSSPNSSNGSDSYDRPARTFNNSTNTSSPTPTLSSSAGGNSGGFGSTGTSTSTGRGGKG
jgi:hypothetical protein